MLEAMRHEKFYASGTVAEPAAGVFAAWVAHENSFASRQPVAEPGGDIVLLLSGECHLDEDTRQFLSAKGRPADALDPAWIISLYQELGRDFVGKLNGLFSGLLIDRRLKQALLFNDRYGMDRIYFAETSDGFYFASEAKALLTVRPELREFDRDGLAQLLGFGCTLEWKSIFRGIGVLPGGSLWTLDPGHCQKRKYFTPETWEAAAPLTPPEFQARLEATLKRILPYYVKTKENLGISLTAGLDSRMIMACLPPLPRKPVCYTYTAERGRTLDDRIGARVARACGLEHQLLRLGADFYSDFAAHADRTVYITDGCFGVTGSHEIYLCRLARGLAPLRLTGVFGGEVMRGVSFLKPVGLAPGLLDEDLNRRIDAAAGVFANLKSNPYTFGAFKNIPWNIYGSWTASRSQISSRSPYLDNELVALVYQTPELYRRSALAALRLVHDNNAALDKIPTDRGFKGEARGLPFYLRRLGAEVTFKIDYIQNEGLPNLLAPADSLFRAVTGAMGIRGLHKFLHYRSWFREELGSYVHDVLTSAAVRENPLWRGGFISEMAAQHRAGRKNHVMEINAILTVEAIERLLFRGLPIPAGIAEDRAVAPSLASTTASL